MPSARPTTPLCHATSEVGRGSGAKGSCWRIGRVGAALLLLLTLGCAQPPSTPPDERASLEAGGPATFVGRAACASCHPQETASWQGSHHDLAMQEATPENVLGDFEAEPFEHFGERTEFSRREEGFFVRTPGPDGSPREYEIAYTFGVEPLQQYLVEVGDGRLQALLVSWDSRPSTEGGQRWFHLYDGAVPHDDPLHWTGFLQNWNYMCADCHSTGLDRGYDAAADRFDTTWREIDVSCEACHGPASRHVAAAQVAAAQVVGAQASGLQGAGVPAPSTAIDSLVDLGRPEGRWVFAEGAANAHLEGGPVESVQTEVCGRCHSRRTPVAPFEHGDDLDDAFRVRLLDESLYHADGQILDEVFVYGSFLQSKMHGAGVTCSDCHDPHSAGLRLEGNALCTSCHRGTVYDVEEHHRHAIGTAGSACVDCHMPAKTYMGVDPRRDHSFRVPRPDLSVRLGTPNACTGCHQDRDDRWAAEVTAGWGVERPFHFGEALHAARTWQSDAASLLTRVVEDSAQPAIARATALAAMPHGPELLPTVDGALYDPDPLVRRGALEALEGVEGMEALRLAAPLLEDPVRTVRSEAARLLASVSKTPAAGDVPSLEAGLEEVRATLAQRAERPETHVSLGNLERDLGDLESAEAAYARALEMLPSLVEARINLADLYRATGRDPQAEALLRDALEDAPDHAALQHALGLTRIRLGRLPEALVSLRRAWELAPTEPRYAYVYGVALHDSGEREAGVRVLAQAVARFPGHPELVAGYRALAGR